MKQAILRLFSILLLGGALAASAHAGAAKVSTDKAAHHQRLDFDLVAEWKNPYDSDDIQVDVVVSPPLGGKIIVPAYYVSGASQRKSSWRAMFTPREAGTYRYQVMVRDDGKPSRVNIAGQFSARKAASKGFLLVRDHWMLQFDNGELFRGVGENIAWESRDNDDSKFFKALHENPRFNYDHMLTKLAKNGGNFARVWMIYWNLPLDWKWVDNNSRYQKTKSQFNESGIKRMDELLEIAEKNGVYLMLALESHVGLAETGWENSPYNQKNGGDAATPEEFFSSPAAKKRYKDKLRFLVAKWSHSENIAAWEFFNEVDNAIYAQKDRPIPDQVVTQWHREMGDYLKEIDPHQHIITTSISHRDVAGLYDLPNLGINQKHIYKGLDSIPATLQQLSAKHQKPFVIGEAGYEWDWSKNFDDFAGNMTGDFKRQLWYGLFNPTPILPMSWWWEYFDEKGMTPYFKGVQEINQRMLHASNGTLKSIETTSSASGVKHFAVEAGASTFVYLYNATGAPITTGIGFLNAPSSPEKPGPAESGSVNITAYDPERQSSSPFGGSLKSVELKANQDLILILEPGR